VSALVRHDAAHAAARQLPLEASVQKSASVHGMLCAETAYADARTARMAEVRMVGVGRRVVAGQADELQQKSGTDSYSARNRGECCHSRRRHMCFAPFRFRAIGSEQIGPRGSASTSQAHS
jgi:hypothetical protein